MRFVPATPKLLSRFIITSQLKASEHPSSLVIGDSSVALDMFQRSMKHSRRRGEQETKDIEGEETQNLRNERSPCN